MSLAPLAVRLDVAMLNAKAQAHRLADSLAAAGWLDTGERFAEARREKLLDEADAAFHDLQRHIAALRSARGNRMPQP